MKLALALGILCGIVAPVGAQFGPIQAPDPNLKQILTGRVLTPDGAPVAGARLRCVGTRKGSKSLVTLVELQSDAAGNYRLDFDAIRKGGNEINSVLAEAPGWGLTIVPTYAIKDQTLDVSLVRAATLRLTFVDNDGNLLPNVPVYLTKVAGFPPQSALSPYPQALLPRAAQWRALTGADGTCEFANLPQGYSVSYEIEDKRWAFSDDYGKPRVRSGAVWLSGKALKAATPEILIPAPLASASIAGRIAFAPNKPLAGATVRVSSGLESREIKTDENGEYKVAGLRGGQYNVRVVLPENVAKEWTARPLEKVVLQEKQALGGQNLVLTKGAMVKGRIVAEENAKPVSDCRVSVYKNGSDYTEVSTSGADGTFEIRVPAGEHFLYVYTDWNGPYARPKVLRSVGGQGSFARDARRDGWKFSVADGDVLNLECHLPPKPKLHPVEVVVLDAQGNPVEGAFVVEGENSRPERRMGKGYRQEGTDAQGRFTVQGPVTVRAFKDGAATLQAVRAEGEKVTLRLEANALAALRGRVLDADGAALSYAEVELQTANEENRYLNSTRANAEGVYVFKNLWPDMAYRVRAKGKGSLPAQSNDLKVQHGIENTAPEFRLTKANLFVAGRVVNLKNQPVAGAVVECYGSDTARQLFTTGADGRFRFEGVMPETLTIEASKKYPGEEDDSWFASNNGLRITKSAPAGADDVFFKIRHF
jgi:protocatechuate 3,4-dioxygenase beta subunit